ncbi:hypothetical protein PHYBLDRAFT_185948 [Phycomyces blakesleeanus NRRL 1555(-)]|uniref:Uncharacterized protein n=1 Tax=Phycomyces blakesleeanus (strain ATCC 8743b / DSM 1359 / FGSC 10004 / NBRC 33097 / NRRL 1555) TaxID=763407 RepID=A0A167P297_PHYB8|nr:hypothetical protein PHYBLDRAFT_185948 [Phycomyces blakesleeanus NRRL 1555(-)]OAD77108.1 hypothetical protein PHYBLDRAFT_185948 [Phycomyces blakesleeanus NRRL 1555(-)]|eukprot:XP_018295148.1 hypothetical protein PHYBLDRAFT_185948 [Phycomyces blakesleeanus NRRL 1555(-)]
MPSNAHYVESLPPSPTIETNIRPSMCPQCYHQIDSTQPPHTSFLCCVFWRSSELPWKCTECGYIQKQTQASGNNNIKAVDSGYDTPVKDESSPQYVPMHAPTPAWVARTGWTPQPDINTVINRGLCTSCDSYVKIEGGNCSQCGIPLAKPK